MFSDSLVMHGTGLVIIEYTGSSTVIHTPATIQGFPVTEIGAPEARSSIVPVSGGIMITRRQGVWTSIQQFGI